MEGIKRSISGKVTSPGSQLRRAFSQKLVSPPHAGVGAPPDPPLAPAAQLHLPEELFGASPKPMRRVQSETSLDSSEEKEASPSSRKNGHQKEVKFDVPGEREKGEDREFERMLNTEFAKLSTKITRQHEKSVQRRIKDETATLNIEVYNMKAKIHMLMRATTSDRFETLSLASGSRSNLAAALDEIGDSMDDFELEAHPSAVFRNTSADGKGSAASESNTLEENLSTKTNVGSSEHAVGIPGTMPVKSPRSALAVPGQDISPGRQTAWNDAENSASLQTFVSGRETNPNASFHPRPVWRRKRRSSLGGSEKTSALVPSVTAEFSEEGGDLRRMESQPGRVASFIVYPTSPKRLVWDVFGSILIVYDMIMIPLRVFDLPSSVFTDFMDWMTLVFWTLNIFASMLVGYTHNGVVVMIPKKIVKHYARTWLFLDLIVVVPDWIFSILTALQSQEDSAGSATRLFRILRFVRSVRLVRLLKLRWVMVKINECIDSEYVSIVANIAKMIAVLLAINHFIACMWFQLAQVEDKNWERHQNWVDFFELTDADWQFQYATAFHWSLTQFTPASMEVQPKNVLERTFAVTVVVFALVGFSYLVGSITGSLTQLRSMQEESSHQFWNVRRFLRQHSVPSALALRINKYLEHAWQRKMQLVNLKSIPIFALLSEQLRNELLCAINVPPLRVHPLLTHLEQFSAVTVQRLATTAISRKQLARRDKLFFPGETATHMYFVVTGILQYYRIIYDDNGDKDVNTERVDEGEDWIAEPVLYTSAWVHLGTLMAHTEADLLLIEAKGYSAAVKLNPPAYLCVQGYAEKFLDWVNNVPGDDLSDIAQGEDIGKMIESFIPTNRFSATKSSNGTASTRTPDVGDGDINDH
mmetsp:Transcript_13347/g.30436  ORF Transcript_13347/g.30436 Transcript_13347/m.30436 type:complete len:872 (+) Transcript_13347:88-2703(+)